MQIRHIKIERFRGIRNLSWNVDGQIICLIGPGDSSKSTILNAIDFALSPRWKIDFNDSDFYNGNTSQPFVITVTVGGLPDEFKADSKFGLELRGWNKNGLRDEPQDDDELVMSVQLMVDKSLEPKWAIVNDRNPTGRPISAGDREAVGVIKIGEFLDRHLTWTRGSVLSRLTGKSTELAGLLAQVSRDARLSVAPAKLPSLTATTNQIASIGKDVGVQPKVGFRPHLDIKAVDLNEGALSLHDGEVPIRLSGLGTRRLITLALQKKAVSSGALALIDEVEEGLEPHRLRRLLRALQSDFRSTPAKANGSGQLLLTTHSPVVVDELSCADLRVVHSNDGDIVISSIAVEIQKKVRHAPEAFLSSVILTCEGATELGFCRALDSFWIKNSKYDAFSVKGVALVDGNGFNSEPYTLQMAKIGYAAAFFGDSDRALNPSAEKLQGSGAGVFIWEGKMCLEQRIAEDLPWSGIGEMLDLALGIHGENSVRAGVISQYKGDKATLVAPLSSWDESSELRAAIGLAAKNGAWFKDADIGEALGSLVTKYLESIPGSNLAVVISNLRDWIDSHG